MREIESLAASLFAFRQFQIEAANAKDRVLDAMNVQRSPDPRPIGRFMVGSGVQPLVACIYAALMQTGAGLCAGALPRDIKNKYTPPKVLVLPEDMTKPENGFPDAAWWVLVDGEEVLPVSLGFSPESTDRNREHLKRTIPLPGWAKTLASSL